MKRKVLYQLSAIGLFVLLKFGYIQADTVDLTFLLGPTDAVISLVTASPSIVRPDSGYFHPSLNVLIDKSCSGFNFWILSFLLLSFLAIKYFDDKKPLLLIIPSALFCSYFLTLFANSSRIIITLLFKSKFSNVPLTHSGWFHEALGVFVYFFCLITTYLLAEFLLLKTIRPNAKLA